MKICDNENFKNSVYIITNVIFIFIFLCIFYFVYVVNVEQAEFKNQLNIIVDNLFDSVKTEYINVVTYNKEKEKISKENMNILINGIIDTLEENITSKSKEAIDNINKYNSNIRLIIYIIISALILSIILFFIIFKCYSQFYIIIKESLIVLIFIAMTELFFLNFISAKYISADPNQIKNSLGQAIHKYIIDNNLI
jgi:hypothetical protein